MVRRIGLVLVVIIPLLAWPRAGAAQVAPRWLADPALLTPLVTIGPNGGQQAPMTIFDMDLLDSRTGWAAAYGNLLRFDGRWWRPHIKTSGYESLLTIDMVSPTDGWIGGTSYVSGGPSAIYLARFRGGATLEPTEATPRDGSRYIAGVIVDIAGAPDGTAWAIGQAVSDVPEWGRPLILRYDGTRWTEQTPPTWHYGRLTTLAVVGGEAWATGLLGRPGGAGADAVRGAIVHWKNGTWSEDPLPALPATSQPFSLYGVQMRDAAEGWAVFFDAGAACPAGRMLHYRAGSWTLVPGEAHGFQAITAFGLFPGTNRGWVSTAGCRARGLNIPARRMRFDTGTFTPDETGTTLIPTHYALVNDEVQWAAAGASVLRWSAERLPTERVAGAPPGRRFFAETGHTLGPPFRGVYEANGLNLGDPGVSPRESLALFGYPISEPFEEINPDTGAILTVQYFERARFEHHPNNPQPYQVLLGRLGSAALITTGRSRPVPQGDPAPGCRRFGETGYDLCAPFGRFWDEQGGLPVFGFPFNQAIDEESATDGKRYRTQWFERERMEHHPELAGTPYEVLLGLLASEDLRARGYLP